MPEAERATLTLCCTHSNCTKVAASETNVRTNRHTHTQAYTRTHRHIQPNTHSTRHTHRYTFYFIIPALSFILLYFTLLLVVVFFGFISTYFTLHFSLLLLLLFVFFAFCSPRTKQKATPAQDQRISVREPVALSRHRQCFALSNDLCVAPTAAVIM